MLHSRSKAFVLLALLTLLIEAPPRAADLAFQPLVVSSNRLQLVLLGNTGSGYAIENSSNLINWSTLFSGTASNGRIEFNGPLPSATMQFFRGRPEVSAIAITPKADTNRIAQLFATEQGGETVLYDTNGTKFTLSFPSNNVATPTAMTMTLVTNLTGLPFAGGMLGAVQIGPDEPDLFGAGKLTISFGTNVDRRRIASFTANVDGSNLSLIPDRVSSNFVTIPITRGGLFGAAIATTQEIVQVSQSVSASTAAARASKKTSSQVAQAPLPTSVLCFPQLVAHANAVRAEIARELRKLQSDMAMIIEIERQRQLVGLTEDAVDIFSQVGPLTCAFYNEHIAPHWPATASNCSLMNVLLQFALGFERQMQLFGIPEGERCTANILTAQSLCPGFKACMKEIEACCISGHQERERLIDLVSLIRQQSLLGIENNTALGCFDLNDAVTQGVIDVCTKSQWTGSIKVTENGEFHERETFVNGFREEDATYDATCSGFATSSTEHIIPGFGLTATVQVEGHGTVRKYREVYSETHNKCGTSFDRDRSEGAGNSKTAYTASISIQSTNYNLGLAFLGVGDGQTFWIDGEEKDEISRYSIGGIGCEDSDSSFNSRTEKVNYLLPSLHAFSLPLSGDTNSISGSTNFAGNVGYPTKITIEWNFTRSKAPQ
jgi:hypothetical protein